MKPSVSETAKRAIPSTITGCGHAFSIAYAMGIVPLPWGIAGLLLDMADGWAARRLQVESEFGSLYDWVGDVVLCAIVLHRLGLVALVPLVLPLQIVLRLRGKHISGRAPVTIILMLLRLAQPDHAW
jgi:phosphatidylglycerophosphate synthase